MTVATMPPLDVSDVLSFQEHIRTWEDEPLTPEKAQGLQQLVAKAVRIASSLQGIWAICSREGSVWETRFYTQRLRFIEFLGGIVVEILTQADEIVARTREKFPEWEAPALAAEVKLSLVAAQKDVSEARRLLEWLNRARPPVNEEMIQRSKESLSRGEGEAVSDMIARLKNGGPQQLKK